MKDQNRLYQPKIENARASCNICNRGSGDITRYWGAQGAYYGHTDVCHNPKCVEKFHAKWEWTYTPNFAGPIIGGVAIALWAIVTMALGSITGLRLMVLLGPMMAVMIAADFNDGGFYKWILKSSK